MKILKRIVTLALICLTLVSCGNATEKTPDIEPADVINDILSQVEMSSMAEVQSDRLSNYIEFDQSKIVKFTMYICGSGGFADEMGLFKLDSQKSADELEKIITERLESRGKDFESYNADESAKLANALVINKGNYVFYCVTPDNDKAKEVFDKYYNS